MLCKEIVTLLSFFSEGVTQFWVQLKFYRVLVGFAEFDGLTTHAASSVSLAILQVESVGVRFLFLHVNYLPAYDVSSEHS